MRGDGPRVAEGGVCPRVCGPSGGRAGDHQVRPRRGSGRRLADARHPRRPLAALSLLPGPAAGPVCACVCAHTAEAPPDPPATAATVVELAGVVVELGPEARRWSRRSIETDAYTQNHHARASSTRGTGAGSRSTDLPKLLRMVPMMEPSSRSLRTASQLVHHALEEVAGDESAAAYHL